MTEERYKYPRTTHLPWSEGVTDDDKKASSVEIYKGMEVVVTLKMDGENTTLYRDGLHARSLDSGHHPSRSWVKGFHAGIAGKIPEYLRICGENVYAQHSIAYDNLESYFLGFSIWNGPGCLEWDVTLNWFEELGIASVPVLYRGVFDEEKIRALWTPEFAAKHEGYVVRPVNPFHHEYFSQVVMKYVRKDHIQTDEHWRDKPVVPNKLKGE